MDVQNLRQGHELVPRTLCACVYAVTRVGPGGSTRRILYVGETEDIAERFSAHHKKSCFDRDGWTHVCTLKEPDAGRRARIEADLIRSYNPVCNDWGLDSGS